MILEETRLLPEELEPIRHLIPGPEPLLVPAGDRPGRSVIPVSETRLDGNELAYLTECVTSNWISSGGEFVGRFERAFGRAVGCAHAVTCSSGTAALHLALAALGLEKGDEVILPAFTMIATANAVSYVGATPILVDVDPVTGNLDPGAVEEKIGPATKAIIAVHTYGHPAEMDALSALAARHGLALIEDAAEAHGARLRDRPVGSLGDVATFSFYGNKILTTGEGGMVTTNDPGMAAVARRLRDHAFSPERHFWHTYLGFNYRMTNLQAAVGLAQTERMDQLVAARRRNRDLYTRHLRGVPGLTLPAEKDGATSVFWMYGIRVEDDFGLSRDELRRRLALRGIETRTFFVPIHLQPIYYRAFAGERYPVSESLGARGMYLPSSACLTEDDVAAVAQEIVRAATCR